LRIQARCARSPRRGRGLRPSRCRRRAARRANRAALPKGLNHIAIVALGGKLYTFGGFERQNRDAVPDANVYDPATDTWAPIAPVPTKRGSIAAAALDGKIHLVGGRDEHSVGTHDVYDASTDRYASAAPLPIGRDHLGLVAYAGSLYAIAGRIDDFDHNSSYVDVYDPAAERWAPRSSAIPFLKT